MYDGTRPMSQPENSGKGRIWKIAALVILLLCALPVLIPIALCVSGGVLVVALCAAGAVLAGVLCVLGGLLGAALCVVAGLLCLAGIQFAALVGIGCGVILLFQAPASGLAVLGACLLMTGAGVLCWIALWQICKCLVRVFRSLVGWIQKKRFARGQSSGRRTFRKERAECRDDAVREERQDRTAYREEVRPGQEEYCEPEGLKPDFGKTQGMAVPASDGENTDGMLDREVPEAEAGESGMDGAEVRKGADDDE